MKKLLFFSLLILLICAIKTYAQSIDCKTFKNGKFKIETQGHITIIERSGSNQLEFFDGAKVPTSFTVNWVDNCTYTLTPHADVFKKYPNTPKNAMLTVKITKTTNNSYTQTSTANFSKGSFTSEVTKIE